MNGHRFSWSPESLKLAEALWREGYHSRKIADRLGGGVTRNAVIGMAYRKGWVRGPVSEAVKAEVARIKAAAEARSRARKIAGQAKRRAEAKKEKEASMPDQPPQPDPKPGSYTLMSLPNNGCKWPVEGAGIKALFCGAKVARWGGPYCPDHYRLSYTPARGSPSRSETHA